MGGISEREADQRGNRDHDDLTISAGIVCRLLELSVICRPTLVTANRDKRRR